MGEQTAILCTGCDRPLTGECYFSKPYRCRACRGFVEPFDCGICNHDQIAALDFVQPEEISWCEAYTVTGTGSISRGVARICDVCRGAIESSTGGRSPIHPYGVRLDTAWLEVCLPCVFRLHAEGIIAGDTRTRDPIADWDQSTIDCNWLLTPKWEALARHYLDCHMAGDDALPLDGSRWVKPVQLALFEVA